MFMFTKRIMSIAFFAIAAFFSSMNAKINVSEDLMPLQIQKIVQKIALKFVAKLKKLPKNSRVEAIFLPISSFIISIDQKELESKDKAVQVKFMNDLGQMLQSQTPEAQDFLKLFQESVLKEISALLEKDPELVKEFFKDFSNSQADQIRMMMQLQYAMSLLAYDVWYDALINEDKASFVRMIDVNGLIPANKRKTALPSPKELLDLLPEILLAAREAIESGLAAALEAGAEQQEPEQD